MCTAHSGNPNDVSSSNDNTVVYEKSDTTQPTVTINLAGDTYPATTLPINFTVVFSEPVADFDATDVAISGTAPGKLTAVVTGSGTTYNVAVGGMAGDGTVRVDIPADAAHDAAGNPNLASTSQYNEATYRVPPDIASVVVAEAGTVKNGTLESNEPLKITWAATSSKGIASQAVAIDGTLTATVKGPYGGLYYSCTIGTRSAGSHSYEIIAIDSQGISSTSNGTFTVVAPAPLSVSSVVVAEASTTKNGILESNDLLKITWAAASSLGIASQTMSVNGTAVKPINGPYGGLYYSCQIGTLTAGNHNYLITATDSAGGRSTISGTFNVVAATVVPPTIGSIVVAEAGATKNGTLESNETLKITWAATSTKGIASQTMTVDGHAMTAIKGPYGGLYYSCTIGTLAAGSHTYIIQATDSKGLSSTSSGSFTVAAPVPPTIASVVVAEVGATKSGMFVPDKALKVTWAASSPNGAIATQTMTIDGRVIAPINGPYGGLYYSCPIGKWLAGTHSYTITATDVKGVSATSSGTFLVAASSNSSSGDETGTVNVGGTMSIARIATGVLSGSMGTMTGGLTVNSGVLSLNGMTPVVGSGTLTLGSRTLGGSGILTLGSGCTVTLNGMQQSPTSSGGNGVDYGSVVDPTACDDATLTAAGNSSLATATSVAASQRADLLATVVREMGTCSVAQDDGSGMMP